MNITPSEALLSLEAWCRERRWRGPDCFDGLNARRFRNTPLYRSRLARMIWTQAFKSSPIDLRRLWEVPEEENPKALALFLLGMSELEGPEHDSRRRAEIRELADRLLLTELRAGSGGGWGYPFDWQSRGFFAPRGTPNIVATSFAGRALLAAGRVLGVRAYREAALRGCAFIARKLARRDEGGRLFFSYIPDDRSRIFNATLLGARLLALGAVEAGEPAWAEAALEAARGVAGSQAEDGSWPYGPLLRHRWIDSFHTGYNLTSLDSVSRLLGAPDLEPALRSGHRYYRTHFFRRDGAPRYYAGRTYPIDIHAAAVAIETLMAMRRLDPRAHALAWSVASWTLDRMQERQQGYFYFQKRRLYTIRIPYMRWAQAWMYYALAVLVMSGLPIRAEEQGARGRLEAGSEALRA